LADSRNAVIFQEICREQQAPKKFITLLCACCTWPKHNRPNFAEIIRDFHSISDSDLELSKEPKSTRNSSKTHGTQSQADFSSRYRTASPTNIRKSKDQCMTEPLYSDEEDEDYFTSTVSQRNANSPSLYSRPISSRKSALRGKTPTNMHMSYRRQEIDD